MDHHTDDDEALSLQPDTALRVVDQDEKSQEWQRATSLLDPLGLPALDDQNEQLVLDVADWWVRHGLRYDMHARNFVVDGKFVVPTTIANRIWKARGTTQQKLYQLALEEIIEAYEKRAMHQLKTRLLDPDRYDRGLAKAELEKFVRLIAAEDSEPDRLAYYSICLSQLIWQVKRRLRGLPTYWELMPILVGPQGTGKSSAVDKFAKPLDFAYLRNGTLDLFADKFGQEVFGRRYLIRLDEVDAADTKMLDTIKRTITAIEVGARKIYTSDELVVTRNANFIGTSNVSIQDKFKDPTGMRRFAEFACRKESYTAEYGRQVAALNYDLIWACETGDEDDCPSQSKRELVGKFQARTVTKTWFDEWCEYHLQACTSDHPEYAGPVRAKPLWVSYKAWMQDQGLRWLPLPRFIGQMERRFGERGRTRNNSTTFDGFYVLAEEAD
jgi:hypothetical protein